jgi:hypothetical protein
MNSHIYLPTPGLTVTDDPSLPVTLVAFLTALGMVNAVTPEPTVVNKTILPSVPEVGKFENANVTLPVIVAV